MSTTNKARKSYNLVTTQSSNNGWLKFAIKPTSFTRQVIVTAIIFAILNTTSIVMIRKMIHLGRNQGNLMILASFAVSLLILRRPTVESFTVYRDYGVQVTKVKGLLIFPDGWNNRWVAQSKFIPRDQIVDIVINEGFVRGFQVIFYLAVIVKDSKKLELLFSVCSSRILANPVCFY